MENIYKYNEFLLYSIFYDQHYLNYSGDFYKKFVDSNQTKNQDNLLNYNEIVKLTTLQRERLREYFIVKYFNNQNLLDYYFHEGAGN